MATTRLQLLYLSACAALCAAEEITLSPGLSTSQFRNALKKTNPGDVVTIEPGTYEWTSRIDINSDDVTIQAAPGGQVFLNGNTQGIRLKGDRIMFKGFSFVESGGDKASTKTALDVRGSHCTISDCNFDGYNSKKYIDITAGSQYNTVTKCNFARRPVDVIEGNLIQVGAHESIVGYHVISYCSFQDIGGDCDARRAAGFTGGCSLADFGNEPIRLGLSSQHFPLATVVEHCYFNNVGLADGETISVKSHNNVMRYNTFENNPQGMIVFRSGGDNVAYGNFFLNSGGVRIKEQNNVWVYNNYFDQTDCNKDDCAAALELNPVKGYTTGITVAFNTFHKVERMKLGKMKYADDIDEVMVMANNIFSAPSERRIFRDANGKTTFRNNMVNEVGGTARYQKSGLPGQDVVGGIRETALGLEDRGDGIFVLAEGSPAIDAATTNFPAVAAMDALVFDQDIAEDVFGRARGDDKDIGASEYGADGDGANRPLTLADVGPDFLRKTARRVTPLSVALQGSASAPMTVAEAEAAAMQDFGEVTMETINAEATMEQYGVRMTEAEDATAPAAPASFLNMDVQEGSGASVSGFMAFASAAGVAVLALAALSVRVKKKAPRQTDPAGTGDYGTHELDDQ